MLRYIQILFFSVLIGLLSPQNVSAQYCEATAENGDFEYISQVVVGDTIVNSESDLYADNTSGVLIKMYRNEDYEIEIVNDNHDTPDQIACWIDWDQDEVFESNETVELNYDGDVGEASSATGTIIPPETAQTGQTRMRIMLANEDPSPCLTFLYGEVEDYVVQIEAITRPPEVVFEADQTNIYTAEEVQFTDKTFLNPQSWQWSITPSSVTYTQGTDQNSQHPVVRFEEAGAYEVTLTSTNDIGASDTTFEDYITVSAFNPPRNINATTEGSHVNLSWDKPNMPGYFDYEIIDNGDALIGATPERATIYDDADFDYTYPVTIEKVRASFYEDYENNSWPDATFQFKIYADDGTTVLYESGEIEAVSYQNIVHELDEPLTLNEDFYLSIVPLDASGAPQSLSRVINPDVNHSWFLYEGEWTRLQDENNGFELVNGIYIAGSKNGLMEISYSEKNKNHDSKSELEDFDLEGYMIYRDTSLVKTIHDPDSTFWIDEELANGEYAYYLKAYYSPQGKSVPSDTATIMVDNTLPEVKVFKDSSQLLMNETFRLDTNVMLDERVDMEFKIYNEGMNDLEIGEFTINHSDFTLLNAPAEIVAGQDTTSFTIRFQPSSDSVSLKHADISFVTNDANENPFEFSIEAIAGKDKWTWMLYLLEDGTGLNGSKDINEWEVNGSVRGRANYLVLYDAQVDSMDGVYYVTKDPAGFNFNIQSPKVTKIFGTDPDMSNNETLEQFLMWVKDNYPAQHYGLTMWDHGSGIFKSEENPGITKDFVGGMKLWEMSDAVQSFKNETGQNIDVIGFDVCLLGQFETAYQFRNLADYVIASELTEPGDGWDYIAGFDTLTTNPDVDPGTTAKLISETYIESYSPGGSQGNTYSTQAVTSNIIMKEEFLPMMDSLADKLSHYLYELKPVIEESRNQAWAAPNVQGGGEKNPNHRDLGNFLQNLTDKLEYPDHLRATAQNTLDAYNEMIISNGYTGSINEDATGVKIWMPQKISSESYVKDYYLNPDLYLDISYTRWDEYLEMYEDPSYDTRPEVNFSVPDTVEKGQLVTPENRSFFVANGYSWSVNPDNVEFVNGTDASSEVPEFKLTETGTYSISLSGQNEYGSDDTTKVNVITVVEPNFVAPENLMAEQDENRVHLSWQAEIEGAIFTEGFENVEAWPPQGWSVQSNDNLSGNNLTDVPEDANAWGLCDSTTFTDQGGNPDPQYIHSGSYSAAIGYTAGSEGDPFTWLITPEISLRENEQLSFWIWYASDENYYTDFDVMIHADGQWTSLLHLTDGSGVNLYEEPVELSLQDYTNKTVKIAFVYQYTDGYQLAIDDIAIDNSRQESMFSAESEMANGNIVRQKVHFMDQVTPYKRKEEKAAGESYIIYRNDEPIASVYDLSKLSYIDTLQENGIYKYYVTKSYINPDGESAPSNSISVTVDYFEELGIENLNSGEVLIYPNPSEGHFLINFSKSYPNAKIYIYNSSGKLVYSELVKGGWPKDIHMPDISSGIYYLEIQTDSGSFSNKLFIK